MRRLLNFNGSPGAGRRWVACVIALIAVGGTALVVSGASSVGTNGAANADLSTARAAAVAKARSLSAKRSSSRARRETTGTNRSAAPDTTRPDEALARDRSGDNSHSAALFAAHSWYVAPPPPPPPPPPPAPPAASLAPPAPTAPPLPFQYIGSYKPDGEAQVFFLTKDDRVYDAKVGDTLENNYSIDGFNGSQLLLTYKPLNIQQQLMVGSAQ